MEAQPVQPASGYNRKAFRGSPRTAKNAFGKAMDKRGSMAVESSEAYSSTISRKLAGSPNKISRCKSGGALRKGYEAGKDKQVAVYADVYRMPQILDKPMT